MKILHACRVCLATDIRLYDIHKNKLNSAFQKLTGIKVTQSDGLPQHLCGYCSLFLLKCVRFKECCKNTHDLLCTMRAQQKITTEVICSIDRTPYQQPTPGYTKVTFTTDVTVNIPCSIKEEFEATDDCKASCSGQDDIKAEIDHVCDDAIMPEELFKYNEKKKINNKVNDTKETKDNNDTDCESINNDIDDFKNDDDDNLDDFLKDFQEVILTKEDQIKELEARKTSSNYLNNDFKCDLCYKGFISDSTYKNHMMRHDSKSGKYDCEICHLKWRGRHALKSHMRATHERRYNCKLCDRVCSARFRAREHIKWHKGYTYTCKYCGKSFGKPTTYLSHLRLRHPSKHSCDTCGESFVSEAGLIMHKKRAHKDFLGNTVKEQRRCSRCNIQFRNLDALRRHQELAADVCMERACVHCGESLPTDTMLKAHIKTHNKDEEVACDMCNQIFNNSKACSIHYERVHAPPKQAYDKSWGTKRPMCEVCGKVCQNTTSLTIHQRLHTGEKPYQCTGCPKTFRLWQAWQIHARRHTGEKPYKCSYCSKAFVHKPALNKHVRIHTGEKPYTCKQCNRSFAQSSALNGHIKTVHLKMIIPSNVKKNKKSKVDSIHL